MNRRDSANTTWGWDIYLPGTLNYPVLNVRLVFDKHVSMVKMWFIIQLWNNHGSKWRMEIRLQLRTEPSGRVSICLFQKSMFFLPQKTLTKRFSEIHQTCFTSKFQATSTFLEELSFLHALQSKDYSPSTPNLPRKTWGFFDIPQFSVVKKKSREPTSQGAGQKKITSLKLNHLAPGQTPKMKESFPGRTIFSETRSCC